MARAPLDILGHTGLKQFDGHIHEEFLRRLEGGRAVKVFREMSENDAITGAILYAIETLTRGVSWPVKPAGDSPEQQKEAEFLRGVFDDMSTTWQDTVSEILSMLVFGYAPMEKIWKMRRGESRDSRFKSQFDDGRIGIRKLEIRGQETLDKWVFDEEGGLDGMWQSGIYTPKPAFIPVSKLALYRTKTHKGNPEGRSILRTAYRSWYFLKRIQEFEAIGVERNLAGLPFATVPARLMEPDATPGDKQIRQDVEDLVSEVRWDERGGIVFPSELDEQGKPTGFKFELIAASGRKSMDTNIIIERYERRIAATVMADFVTSTYKVGFYASLKAKHQFFGVALSAMLDMITETTNRFVVQPLYEFNGVPKENRAKLEHGDIGKPEITEIADFLSKLAPTGFINPTAETEKKLRQIADMPLEEDEKSNVIPMRKDFEGDQTVWSLDHAALLDMLERLKKSDLSNEEATVYLETAFPISHGRAAALVESVGAGETGVRA